MKEIALTQGKVAIVSNSDFKYLNQFKWHLKAGKANFYAARNVRVSKYKQKRILMHREILALVDANLLCDHKDRNGLNNIRSNLRTATISQNCANKSSAKKSKSKYLGVSKANSIIKTKTYTYWRAIIQSNHKRISLGLFETEIEAAIAYNNAAIKLHKEFANLNIIL